MAARENQGLQIALIIFVMLTILLSVSTFIFFKKFKEEREKIQASTDAAKTATEERKTASDEAQQLKQMIGHPSDAKLDVILKTFEDDKKLYGAFGMPAGAAAKPDQPAADANPDAPAEGAADAPAADFTIHYKALLERAKTELDKRGAQLIAYTEDIKKLEATNVANRAADTARIAEHEKGAKTAQTQLTDERVKLNTTLDTTKKAQSQVGQLLKAKQDEMTKLQAERDAELKKLTSEITVTAREKGELERVVEQSKKEDFDQADGMITWIVGRDRLVYINLGSADALRPQVTFSVYAEDASRLVPTTSKGKIEVTRIMGPHSAEARILEDSRADPLLPRDRIFSPVWNPGRRMHVAIAGFTDIDGDGDSDRAKIRDLILSSGGIIDAEIQEDGKRVPPDGKLTVDTRYLILGERPTEATGAKSLDQFTKIVGEAEKVGVAQMNLQQFLDMMGYKTEERTVELGRGANPRDFKAKSSDKPRAAKGEFRERRPPARGDKGAY